MTLTYGGWGSQRDRAELNAYNEAYNAGFYGRESTETMNQDYYQKGVEAAQAAEEKRLAKVGKGKAGTGSVSYIGTVTSDADISTKNSMKISENTFTHLEEQQQSAASAIQEIAKATSINFVLYEGQGDDSGSITVENGKYEAMSNTLYIDLNSGKTREGQGVVQYTIMQTVAHEMTHFIEHNSKSGYATLQNLVRKTLEERGQDFDALVDQKVHTAERSGIELTRDGAVYEVVADASEMMLKDTKALQQLAQQNKSLATRVKDFVSGLLDKIRKALGKVGAQHPEAKALMEAEQYVSGLQEAWDNALMEAVGTVNGSETGETWHGIPVVDQFELREPVEKKGNLVATHAVSTQNLMRMLDEGTMVGMSLAVAQADSHSSSTFGDNTLVFYASAIDPETNPDNHIFGFDAWTPRRPRTVYQKNESAIQQARETYVKTLQDSGIDAKIVKSLEGFFDEQLQTKPHALDQIKTKNGLRNVFMDVPSVKGQNIGVNALYLLQNGVTAEQINEAYNGNTRALIDMFQNSQQLMESLNQFKTEITSGFYEGRMWQPGITDTNERSDSTLADITVENTPDNALSIMKQMPLTDQGDSVGADGIRRKIPLVYNTLDEVRNDQGRLSSTTNITKEDLFAADAALGKFEKAIRIGNQSTDKIEGILQNAAANNLSISDTVRALWKAGYIKANKKNVGEVMNAIQSFRNSPTNYFEAKLMRKSGFSEVAAAVVRESSTDLISRLKENGIRVLTYDGTLDDRVSKVNSVKEAQFSLRETVEQKGNLIAVHNIKENDLLGTLRLGGFPMPSIAIIKAKEGHTMYGDYSVVFSKDTIDPQADKANKVYGADAWTPTFPPVETEIKSDVMYNVKQEMNGLAGQVDSEYATNASRWFGNFGGLDTTNKKMSDIADSAWNNSGMVAAYLADHGEKVDILEKDVPVKRDYNPARASMYDKALDIVPLSDIAGMKPRELLDTYGDQLSDSISLPFAHLNEQWKTGDLDAGKRMLDLLRQAKSYEDSGRDTSAQTEKAKDYDATYKAMKERIDRDDFNAWVAQKMQGAFGAQGIYNGKDRYTSSGSSRSFKSLHNDLTADNVVKSMLTQEESYISPTDAKGLMAAASSMYKSIAEIKGDSNRLGKISEAEYNAKIASANNLYHDFLNAIEALDVTEMEDVGELLVKAAKQRMNASAISALLKRNGYSKATLNASKMAKQLIDTVQNIPTGYFEAKPQRVVNFNEVRMVIAPDSMGSDLESALNEYGIPYTTYTANDEADRLAKLNGLEDVQFSPRENDYLLNGSEYRRLRSEWSNYKYRNYQYTKSQYGGIVVDFDDKLVYTDRNGNPMRTLTVVTDDRWLNNDIIEQMTKLEERRVDYEAQQRFLESVFPAGSAHFDYREDGRGTSRNQRRAAVDNRNGQVRKGNRADLSDAETSVYDEGRVKKFSLRDPVETDGELVATHNLSAQNLIKLLTNFDGIPMPSIAIFKAYMKNENYGDISVVFGKETIDPEANEANRVYGNDAFTAEFPWELRGEEAPSVTAEDVVKMMLQMPENGDEDDAFSMMGRTVKRYESIDDIRADSDRLEDVTGYDLSGVSEGLNDLYASLDAEDLKGTREVNKLLENVAREDMYAEDIETLFADAGYSIDEDVAQQVRDLIDFMQNVYTNYFEAKPQRVVGFDEIRMVLYPEGTSSELIDLLNERGIPNQEYTDRNDRVDKLNNMDEVKFSPRTETEADLTRQYLESMEVTDSMDANEKWLLEKYQRTQKEIAEKEALAVSETQKASEATTMEERTKAENRAKVYRQQANRLRSAMRTMERSSGFGGLMRRSEEVVQRYMQYSDLTQATDLSDRLNEELTSLNSQLESAAKTIQSTEGAQRTALARGMLDEKSLTQAGKTVRSTFGTRMSGKEISDRLALAYTELYATEGEQGVQNFAEVMRGLAKDVLSRSNRRYQSATLDDLRENLQGSISLTDAQKQELKNAGISQSEFKRMMSGVVNVSDGGTSLASIVSNAEYYNSGIISQIASTDSEGDMILKLYNLVSEEKAKERSFALDGMSETDSINYTMAEIMGTANIHLDVGQNTMDAILTAMKQGSESNQKVVSKINAAMKNVRNAKITGEQLWKSAANADQTARQALEYYRALDEQRRVLEEKEIIQQLKSDAITKFREDRAAQEYARKANAYKRRIEKTVKGLNNMLLHETDYKNVPEELKAYVGEVVTTFGEKFGSMVFSGKQAKELLATYEKLRNSDSSFMQAQYDADMADNLQALNKLADKYLQLKTSGSSKSRLEKAQIRLFINESLNDVVNNVKTMVKRSTETRVNGRKAYFADLADKTVSELQERPDHLEYQNKLGDVTTWLERSIVTGNMTPVYFFDHMGNKVLKNMFKDFQTGANKWAFISKDAQEYIQNVRKQYKYTSWVDADALEMTTQQGEKIKLTKEQARNRQCL